MLNCGYKTKNGNFLIPSGKIARFIDAHGNHIRFVYDTESDYLQRVLEPVNLDDTPKPIFRVDKNK